MRTTSKMAVSRLMSGAALGIALPGKAVAPRCWTPAQKELAKAERKLEAARARVSVTAEHLSATQSLRMARAGGRACLPDGPRCARAGPQRGRKGRIAGEERGRSWPTNSPARPRWPSDRAARRWNEHVPGS